MDSQHVESIRKAQQLLLTIQEMSKLLNTGLSSDLTAICVRLCEAGIDPDILACLIRTLQNDVKKYQDNSKQTINGHQYLN